MHSSTVAENCMALFMKSTALSRLHRFAALPVLTRVATAAPLPLTRRLAGVPAPALGWGSSAGG